MSHGPEPWRVRPDHDPVAPPGRDEAPTSAATPPRPGSVIIRPMPTAGEAPSFEALAMQSVLSRARDNARFSAPERTDDQVGRKKGLPVRGLVALAVGILVLGVVGGALWVSLFRAPKVDDSTIVKVTESAGATLRTPQETVRGYLDALAAGDIEKAITFGPLGGDGSEALLTPTAYGAMPVDARPSNIRIVTGDPLATEVNVIYALAGKDVETAMRVTRLDSGSYQMARTTVTIQMQVVGGDNLPTFMNGIEVDHRVRLEVVPGTYTPSTGLPFVAFQPSSTISILSLAYTDTTGFPMNPELTPAGRTALLVAAQTSLDRCIASSELTPTGCPNAIRAPQPVTPGSVTWTLLNDATAWSSFTPTLSSTDQSVAVATVPLKLRVSMKYTDGRTSGNNDQARTVAVSATMLGKEAGAVTVTWAG